MERVTAQCYCFPYTGIEILDYNFNDPEPGRFKVIQVNDHGPNQKPIGGFLSDLHCVIRRSSHCIRDF